MLAVDASAVGAMMFREPPAEQIASQLAAEPLYAPTLIDYELASMAWKKLRRHPERRNEILAGFTLAQQLRMTRIAPAMHEVLALAYGFDITPYDASYLWVAQSRRARLVTLDVGLARIAARL
jgi:predicted nucleic acid-binding protein